MSMKYLAAALVFAGSSVGLIASSSTASAKSCVIAGGEATMITPDLARFMANAALKNSMKDKGLTPVGMAKVTCNDPAPLSYCLAKQRACK